MTYLDTIISCLEHYQSIFPNRLAVDTFLFTTIGNGYEWIGGQLVESNYKDYENIAEPCYESLFKLPEELKERYDYYQLSTIQKSGRKSHEKWDKEHPALAALFPHDYSNLPEEDYYVPANGLIEYHINVCEYSAIAEIPNDIQPDWLEAIKHFIEFVLKNKELLKLPRKALKYFEQANLK